MPRAASSDQQWEQILRGDGALAVAVRVNRRLFRAVSNGVLAGAWPLTQRDGRDHRGRARNGLGLEAPPAVAGGGGAVARAGGASARQHRTAPQVRLALGDARGARATTADHGQRDKRVRTSTGLKEEPDWSTRLKACRFVLAGTFAALPELYGQASRVQPDRRTLRIVP
jgi:hypothetical protein